MAIVRRKKRRRIDRALRVLCAFLIFSGSFPLPPARAQIIADPEADAGFRPQIRNGGAQTPLIDITTPESGVSHNKYTDFTVRAPGAVMNNSPYGAVSELLGRVTGNENLSSSGAADVIVHEVTSHRPSRLQGRMEVAGARADVIIANPNGLSCDGCATINTGALTLSTGLPEIAGSNVTLRVQNGVLEIGSGGLDGVSGGLNRLSLAARKIVLSGPLSAQERVTVSGGAQRFSHGNARGTFLASPEKAGETLAVDGRQYGAMRANRVVIIGTEAGLGVRALGALAAGEEGVWVQGAGDVRLRAIESRGAIAVTAKGAAHLERDATAHDKVTLRAASFTAERRSGITGGTEGVLLESLSGATRLSGVIQSAGAITVQGGAAVHLAGRMQAQGALDVTAAGDAVLSQTAIIASGARIGAGGEARLEDPGFTVPGAIAIGGRDLHLGANTQFAAPSLTPSLVRLTAARRFSSAADLRSHTNVVMNFGTHFSNLPGGVVQGMERLASFTGDLENAGRILEAGTLRLALGNVTNHESGVVTGNGITLTLGGALTNAGLLQSSDALQGNIAGEATNRGKMIAAGTFSMTADAIANSGLIHGGTSVALRAQSGALTNEARGTADGVAKGTIQSEGGVTLTASGDVTNGGNVFFGSGTRLRVTGDAITNSGLFYESLRRAAVGEDDGASEAAGTANADSEEEDSSAIALAARGAFTNAAGGVIQGAGALGISATGAAANSGTLRAGSTLDLTGKSILNAGLALGEGRVRLSVTGESFTNTATGILRSLSDALSVGASTPSASDDTGAADGATPFQATNRGKMIAAGTFSMTAGALTNSGLIHGGTSVVLRAQSGALANEARGTVDDVAKGTIQSEGDVTLTASGDVTNEGNVFFGSGTRLRVTGDAITNSGLFYESLRREAVGEDDGASEAAGTANDDAEEAASAIALAARGAFTNAAGGVIQGAGALGISATGAAANSGTLRTGSTLDLTGKNILNAGLALGEGRVGITVTGESFTNTATGVLRSLSDALSVGAPTPSGSDDTGAADGATPFQATNRGKMIAAGTFSMTAGALTNSGLIHGGTSVALRAQSGALTNEARGTADGVAKGAIQSEGGVTLTASGDVTNGGNVFFGAGTRLRVTGDAITNSGLFYESLRREAGGEDDGASAGEATNADSDADVDDEAPAIALAARGAFTNAAGGVIQGTGALGISATGAAANSGTLRAGSTLDLTGKNILNAGLALGEGRVGITVTGESFTNTATGVLRSLSDALSVGASTPPGSSTSDTGAADGATPFQATNRGKMIAAGAFSVTAGALTNSGLIHGGTSVALRAQSGALTNEASGTADGVAKGAIQSEGGVTLTASGDVTNEGNVFFGSGTRLRVTGDAITNSGLFYESLRRAAVGEDDGASEAAGTANDDAEEEDSSAIALAARGAFTNAAGGVIQGAGALGISATGVSANSGTLRAGSTLDLTGQNILNAGLALGEGRVRISVTGESFTNAATGVLRSLSDALSVGAPTPSRSSTSDTGAADGATPFQATNRGKMIAAGTFSMTAGALTNSGLIHGGTSVALRAQSGTLANEASGTADDVAKGAIQSEGGVTLTASGDVTNGGNVFFGSGTRLRVTGDAITNSGLFYESLRRAAGGEDDGASEAAGTANDDAEEEDSSAIALAARGAFTNAAGGVIQGTGALGISAQGAAANSGTLRAGSTLNLTGKNILNAGLALGEGRVRISVTGESFTNTATGILRSLSDALSVSAPTPSGSDDTGAADGATPFQATNRGKMIAAGTFSMTAGALTNSGLIHGGTSVALRAQSGTLANEASGTADDVAKGAIQSEGGVTLTASGDVTNEGNVFFGSGMRLRVTGDAITNSGLFYESLRREAGGEDDGASAGEAANADSEEEDSSAIALAARGAFTNAAGGVIQGTGALGISATGAAANSGTLRAGSTLDLTGKSILNAGLALGEGRVRISVTGESFTNAATGVLRSLSDALSVGAPTPSGSDDTGAADGATPFQATNRGKMIAAGAFSVTADAIANSGLIHGGTSVALKAQSGALANEARGTADGVAKGAIQSEGGVTLTASGDVTNGGNVFFGSGTRLRVTGDAITNSGLFYESLRREAGGEDDGASAGEATNADSDADVDDEAPAIALAARGAFTNAAGGVIQGAGALGISAQGAAANSGTLRAGSTLNLTGKNILNAGLALGEGRVGITVTGESFTNTATGVLRSLSDALSVSAPTPSGSDDTGAADGATPFQATNRGKMIAAGTFSMTADAIANSGLIHGGTSVALRAQSGALANEASGTADGVAKGAIQSEGGVTLTASGDVTNEGNVFFGSGTRLRVTGDAITNSGLFYESLRREAGGEDERASAGEATNADSDADVDDEAPAIALTARGAFTNAAGGVIQGAGALGISATGAAANSGTLRAGSTLDLTGQSILNAGLALGEGRVGITVTGESFTNAATGVLRSLSDALSVGGGAADGATPFQATNRGKMIAAGTFSMTAGALTNSGLIHGGTSVALRAQSGALTNEASGTADGVAKGAIQSEGGVTLTASGDVTNEGNVFFGSGTRLRVTGDAITNSGLFYESLRRAVGEEDDGASAGEATNADSEEEDSSAIALAARGAFTNAAGGVIQGTGALGISAQGAAANSGTLRAGSTLSMRAAALTNSGFIQGRRAVALTSNSGALANEAAGTLVGLAKGTVQSEGGVTLTASGDVTNGGNVFFGSGTRLRVTGNAITNSGLLYEIFRRVSGGEGGGVSAGRAANDDETPAIALSARGALTNAAGGTIQGTGALGINAAGAAANRGRMISGGLLSLAAESLLNTGLVSGTGGLTLRLSGSGFTNRAGGVMQSRSGSLSLARPGASRSSASLLFTNRGRMIVEGALSVTADALTNSGLIHGGASVTLRAGSGAFTNAAQGTASGLSKGIVQSEGAVDVNVSGDAVNGGTLLSSSGALRLEARNITNRGTIRGAQGRGGRGSLAWSDTRLIASGRLTNESGGKIQSAGALAMRAGREAFNSGWMIAAQGLSLSARAITNRRGGVIQGQNRAYETLLQTTGGAFTNAAGGRVGALGALRVEAGGAASNAGSMLGSRSLSLEATAITNRSAIKAIERVTLVARGNGTITNESAGVVMTGARGTLEATAGGDLTNRGEMKAYALSLEGDRITNANLLHGENTATLTTRVRGAVSFRNEAGSGGAENGALVQSPNRLRLVLGGGHGENAGRIGAKSLQVEGADFGNSGILVVSPEGGPPTVSANAGHTFALTGTLTNSGAIKSASWLSVKAQGLTNAREADILATEKGRFDIGTGGVSNRGRIASKTVLAIDTEGTLTNRSVVYAEDLRLGAQEIRSTSDGNTEGLFGNANVTIEAGRLRKLTAEGRLAALEDDALGHLRVLRSGGSLSLTLTGQGLTIAEEERIALGGNLTLDLSDALVNRGAIGARGTLSLTSGQSIRNDGGVLRAGGAMMLEAGGRRKRERNLVQNRGGTIEANGNITIRAGKLVNEATLRDLDEPEAVEFSLSEDRKPVHPLGSCGGGCTILSAEYLRTKGSVRKELDRAALIQASGDMALSVEDGAIDNDGGMIRAEGNITIEADALSVEAASFTLYDAKDVFREYRRTTECKLRAPLVGCRSWDHPKRHKTVERDAARDVLYQIPDTGIVKAGGALRNRAGETRNTGLLEGGQTVVVDGRSITNGIEGDVETFTAPDAAYSVSLAPLLRQASLSVGAVARKSVAASAGSKTYRAHGTVSRPDPGDGGTHEGEAIGRAPEERREESPLAPSAAPSPGNAAPQETGNAPSGNVEATPQETGNAPSGNVEATPQETGNAPSSGNVGATPQESGNAPSGNVGATPQESDSPPPSASNEKPKEFEDTPTGEHVAKPQSPGKAPSSPGNSGTARPPLTPLPDSAIFNEGETFGTDFFTRANAAFEAEGFPDIPDLPDLSGLPTTERPPHDVTKIKADFGTVPDLSFAADPIAEAEALRMAVRMRFGRDFLHDEFESAHAQRDALYRNAVAFAKLNPSLRLGEPLTMAQIRGLTRPLLWYVNMLVDGEQRLVPRLYLPETMKVAVHTPGSLIGQDIHIDLTGTLGNMGDIAADNYLSIAAGDIHNERRIIRENAAFGAYAGYFAKGGNIIGKTVRIESAGSVRNLGGRIASTGAMDIRAQGNVINEAQRVDHILTGLHGCRGAACGKRGVAFGKAEIAAAGTLFIATKAHFQNVGSWVSATGDIGIVADKGVDSRALIDSYIIVDTKKKSLLKKSRTIKNRIVSASAGIESTDGRVSIATKGHASFLGTSLIAGGGDVRVKAGGDIRAGAVVEEVIDIHKKSGFGGGGIGVFRYSSVKERGNRFELERTRFLATGDVTLAADGGIEADSTTFYAGKDLSLIAKTGDVTLTAKQLERFHHVKTKSFSLIAPGAELAQAIEKDGVEGAGRYLVGRNATLSTLKALKENPSPANLLQSTTKIADANLEVDKEGNFVNPFSMFASAEAFAEGTGFGSTGQALSTLGLTKVKLSWKQTDTQEKWSESYQSTAEAARDIAIRAEAGNAELLGGTQIKAKRNVTIRAGKDIRLEGLADYYSRKHEETSASVSFDLVTKEVSGSVGEAEARDRATTWRNARVEAGGVAKLDSGADITLDAAEVEARRIEAEAGGDITITSRQSERESQSHSAGVSLGGLTEGVTSGGVSLAVSDETSRKTQQVSGLFADETKVRAGGALDLTGAAVVARKKAVDVEAERVTHRDLHDSERSTSVSLEASLDLGESNDAPKEKQKAFAGSLDVGLERLKKEGITRATISKGRILVRADPDAGLEALNRQLDKIQEVTKDERVSVYITIPIPSEALHKAVDVLSEMTPVAEKLAQEGKISPEEADLIAQIAACGNRQGFNLWLWIVPHAYAEADCSDVTMEKRLSYLSPDTWRALIENCKDPAQLGWARGLLVARLLNELPPATQRKLLNMGRLTNSGMEELIDLMAADPTLLEAMTEYRALIRSCPESGAGCFDGVKSVYQGVGWGYHNALENAHFLDRPVPSESPMGVDTRGYSWGDYLSQVYREEAASQIIGGVAGVAAGKAIATVGTKIGKMLAKAGTKGTLQKAGGNVAEGTGKTARGAGPAHSAANAIRLRRQLASQEIAAGHAFGKHVVKRGEFRDLGISTREQFASHIEGIMNNPSATRSLRGGRTAFWDDATGTVVIRHQSAANGGTAFRPVDGRAYFEGLR